MNNVIEKSETLIRSTLEFILARSDQLIDTKINIVTGEEFSASSESCHDPDVVFTWIQGRGLESLAQHAFFFADEAVLRQRIERLAANTLDRMEKIRKQNAGRVFFSFNQQGRASGKILQESNFSDLFYSKGLLCAAHLLGLEDVIRDAEVYFKRTVENIGNDFFQSDQQAFDPKNPVLPVPGKFTQGPKMIALGGLAAAYEITGNIEYLQKAKELISYIFKYHVNASGDLWEAINANRAPWREDGKLLTDPGHALEFVGLSLKCLLRMLECGNRELVDYADSCRDLYPVLLKRNFQNGFNPDAGGIYKSFDLVSRKAINSDMPWWSLPETMRAAALTHKFCNIETEIIETCADAFFANYINPEVGHLQYQTRSARGEVVDAIPAVPDADPGYHTNLSLIDMLRAL